jgi:hypothetical protein
MIHHFRDNTQCCLHHGMQVVRKERVSFDPSLRKAESEESRMTCILLLRNLNTTVRSADRILGLEEINSLVIV